MTDLYGRIALVTGSVGAGIGRSTALALARRGADVVLNFGTGRGSSEVGAMAGRVVEAIEQMGRRALLVEADTKTESDVSAMLSRVEETLGAVDILVNNAGGPWKEEDFAALEPQRWRLTLAAEIAGPAYLISRALPHMRSQRWGRIVNVTIDFTALDLLINTAYGHVLEKYPYPFAVGKAARQKLTELLAYAELKHGVTVNSVQPGVIEEMTYEDALAAAEVPRPPERPYATPADVANAIVHLCSEEGRFLTNCIIRIPGNLYSRLRPA